MLPVLDHEFVSQELQRVRVAVASCGEGGPGRGEQVRVLHACRGEFTAQPVDRLDCRVGGRGVRPRRVQNWIPEIRRATAVHAALMYWPSGVEAT